MGPNTSSYTSRSKKEMSLKHKRELEVLLKLVMPVKNAGNEAVALFALLLLPCKWTILTELSSITHKVRGSFLAVKDIQTIWMSNDGLDSLNLSRKIKSADYDYAGAVVTA